MKQTTTQANDPSNGYSYTDGYHHQGLTKREYFAAMAMQGLLAAWGQPGVTDFEGITLDAVNAADHLINALNQQG